MKIERGREGAYTRLRVRRTENGDRRELEGGRKEEMKGWRREIGKGDGDKEKTRGVTGKLKHHFTCSN